MPAGIGFGPKRQEQWDFRFDLPKGTRDLGEVDWAQPLPPNDVTGWVSLDHSNKRIEMNPQEAVPDSQ